MKISIYLALGMLVISLTPVWGQDVKTIDVTSGLPVAPVKIDKLTKFNLDFPGGTPKDLVAAIEKAIGKPLNAIIPQGDADLQLPPLKMNDVVTPQLFAALKAASSTTFTVPLGNGSYSTYGGGYGFETGDQPSDASVWYFHALKPPVVPPSDPPQKVCKFYLLSPYLDRGFTVDDITTAIQTGWKMAGVTPTPGLNYHKETKLLIAYGEPAKLSTIDDVLKTLPQSAYSLPAMESHIRQLQNQVDELTKKIPAFPPAAAPEEKSGK